MTEVAAAERLLASGKVTAINGTIVTFLPADTSYELQLLCPGYDGPIGKPVLGTIRISARKIWTVPSGGNFIAPIFGPPRIVQGRVRRLEQGSMVVQAGVAVLVELPDDDIAYDLARGPVRVGALVNVTALPGAQFSLAAIE
jgi:hypothetical protein